MRSALTVWVLAFSFAACKGDEPVAPVKPSRPPVVVAPPDEPAPPTTPAPAPAPGTGVVRPKPSPEGSVTDPDPPTPGTPSAPSRTPRPISPKPSGVEQVGATRWTVTRALVDRWVGDPNQLGVVRESGAGWAVQGVRQRAAFHLGMRNSDIVLEVNGHKLDTQVQLLAAWLDLKNDTSFDVVFLRDGDRLVYHYDIVQ